MNNKIILTIACITIFCFTQAQQVTLTPEQIKGITPEWKGERSADGRPRVSDALLERLKNISIEEAWGVLRNKGYQNQYEGDWMIMYPDSVMTGPRSYSAVYAAAPRP